MAAFCFFFLAAPCSGENSQTLATSFQSLANDLGTQRPWIDGEPTPARKQVLAQLRALAKRLMQQPDFATTVPALLNQYRAQDGYPRQMLFDAILTDRKHQKSDLPLLRTVFLATIDFTYDHYPLRTYRYWYTPDEIKNDLAEAILLSLDKPTSLYDNPDKVLLDENPKAWLQKYAP